jgi:hypothetical protein
VQPSYITFQLNGEESVHSLSLLEVALFWLCLLAEGHIYHSLGRAQRRPRILEPHDSYWLKALFKTKSPSDDYGLRPKNACFLRIPGPALRSDPGYGERWSSAKRGSFPK